LFLLRSEDNEDEEHFCAAKTTKLKGIRLFDSYVIKEVAGIHEVHVHGEDSMKSYLSEKAEKLSFATVQAMAASIVLKPINEAVDPVLKHLFGSITQDVDEVDHEGRRRSFQLVAWQRWRPRRRRRRRRCQCRQRRQWKWKWRQWQWQWTGVRARLRRCLSAGRGLTGAEAPAPAALTPRQQVRSLAPRSLGSTKELHPPR
jgi:hypothetical protein